jgi:hypothetical protein
MDNKHTDGDHLRPSLFCNVTQRRFVAVYRCFGTICCPETLVNNQQPTLPNTPEEQRPQPHCSSSPKSRGHLLEDMKHKSAK